MSGHSRWAGIKHKKAIIDSKRGKVFTRINREITIAAKTGGGKVDANPRLRKAIEDARAANMPQENIKRAIQRGTGEIPGLTFEEVTYEGYGPGGVAVFVEGTTDNKNRTTSEIRHIFADHGGNMGESGCVAWMFENKGLLTVLKNPSMRKKSRNWPSTPAPMIFHPTTQRSTKLPPLPLISTRSRPNSPAQKFPSKAPM